MFKDLSNVPPEMRPTGKGAAGKGVPVVVLKQTASLVTLQYTPPKRGRAKQVTRCTAEFPVDSVVLYSLDVVDVSDIDAPVAAPKKATPKKRTAKKKATPKKRTAKKKVVKKKVVRRKKAAKDTPKKVVRRKKRKAKESAAPDKKTRKKRKVKKTRKFASSSRRKTSFRLDDDD
jgi:hypothetical protein